MTAALPAIHANDSLVISVTVSDGAAPLDLSGASVTAGATSVTGGSVAIAAAVTDAAAGVFRLSIPAGLIGAGVYAVQARVTLPTGEAQTVISTPLKVQQSVL